MHPPHGAPRGHVPHHDHQKMKPGELAHTGTLANAIEVR